MFIRLYAIIVLFLFSNQLIAQQINDSQEPGIAIFLEWGGKWLGSANIDFPINDSKRYGFGISPVYGDLVPTI